MSISTINDQFHSTVTMLWYSNSLKTPSWGIGFRGEQGEAERQNTNYSKIEDPCLQIIDKGRTSVAVIGYLLSIGLMWSCQRLWGQMGAVSQPGFRNMQSQVGNHILPSVVWQRFRPDFVSISKKECSKKCCSIASKSINPCCEIGQRSIFQGWHNHGACRLSSRERIGYWSHYMGPLRGYWSSDCGSPDVEVKGRC